MGVGGARKLATSRACPDSANFFLVIYAFVANMNNPNINNARMAKGDEALLSEGTLTSGECNSEYSTHYEDLYGTIRYKQDNLGYI